MRLRTGQGGSSGGKEKTPPPVCEPPILKKKRLIFIDDDRVSIMAGAGKVRQFCDVPDSIPVVTSLKAAQDLVDKYQPDIVVSDKLFDDQNPNACYELLRYIKAWYPKTKVVLCSGTLAIEDEYRGGPAGDYDAVVAKGSPDFLPVIMQLSGTA